MLGSFMQGVNKHMSGMQEASKKHQEDSQRRIDSLQETSQRLQETSQRLQESSQRRIDSLQETSQRQIDTLSQEVKRSAVQIQEKMLSLAAGPSPSTSSELPPLSANQDKHNPWRSCVWLGLSADRTKLLSPSGTL